MGCPVNSDISFLLNGDIYYGHCDDFKDLPGSCLLVMALVTCIASVSHNVESACLLLDSLSLDNYPDGNVSGFVTEAQQLIKITFGDYALPVNTGSRLLNKMTKTSSEFFNQKIFTLLDAVKPWSKNTGFQIPRLWQLMLITKNVGHLG